MRKKIETLKEKYSFVFELIPYAFFGVLTTAVNWGAFKLLYSVLELPTVPSNIAAWILAVAFAFFTNKFWVFKSRSTKKKTFLKEATSFALSRAGTGIVDVVVMYVAVDVMGENADVWKVISNIIVIILNYGAGKFLVFKKKRPVPYEDIETEAVDTEVPLDVDGEVK